MERAGARRRRLVGEREPGPAPGRAAERAEPRPPPRGRRGGALLPGRRGLWRARAGERGRALDRPRQARPVTNRRLGSGGPMTRLCGLARRRCPCHARGPYAASRADCWWSPGDGPAARGLVPPVACRGASRRLFPLRPPLRRGVGDPPRRRRPVGRDQRRPPRPRPAGRTQVRTAVPAGGPFLCPGVLRRARSSAQGCVARRWRRLSREDQRAPLQRRPAGGRD